MLQYVTSGLPWLNLKKPVQKGYANRWCELLTSGPKASAKNATKVLEEAKQRRSKLMKLKPKQGVEAAGML
jgi:hypothetical protein